MSKKPKVPGSTPTRPPARLPRSPQQAEDLHSSRSMRTRPRGVPAPRGQSFPPTRGPRTPPRRKPGCGTLLALALLLAIVILYVKSHR